MFDTLTKQNRFKGAGRAFLALAALLAFGAFAPVTALAAAVPGAGQLLEQIPAPPPPTQPVGPGLEIRRPRAGAAPSSKAFRVEHIRIVGNTLFATRRLHALVASGEGRALTLAQARALAERITRFYRAHGYPVDQAYIPVQTLKDATLTIAVVEARYGRISLKNRSRAADALVSATLSPLRPGAAVAEAPLSSSLLLLNEIPGVSASSVLRPGVKPGTSDLTVEAQPLPRVTGSIGIDDYGDRYTGRARLSAHLAVNNPLHGGGRFTLGGLSAGSRLNYGRLGYRRVVTGAGTVLGVSGSLLHYRLGEDLKDLDAHGNAATGQALVRQPMIRSTTTRLDMQLVYEYQRLHDDIDAGDIQNDRHLQALRLSFSGAYRDHWGLSSASLTLSSGRLDFDNAAAGQADARGADTQGNYGKLNLSLSRLQRLTGADSLYVSASAQLSNYSLDSSELFYLGGPGSISGYDPATIGGDKGGQIQAELRHDFRWRVPGLWQTVLFINDGYVHLEDNNVAGQGHDSANLSSGGVGLDWQYAHGWAASARVAAPFGPEPSLLANESRPVRFWGQIQKVF